MENKDKILNSKLHPSIKLYRNTIINNSLIDKGSSIGDYCLILNSSIKEYVAINRRNYIQNTHIGKFTYTNFNTLIRYSTIENFCSISWNVSIGGKNHDYHKVSNHSIWRFNNI